MQFIGAGRAFILSGRQFGDIPHLWFVLTDPDSADKVIAVHLVTAKEYTDSTVTLQVGDHPFIKHATNVEFAGALIFPVSKLNKALARGRCKPNADASPELLDRLRKGLLASRRTPNCMADYGQQHFPK